MDYYKYCLLKYWIGTSLLKIDEINSGVVARVINLAFDLYGAKGINSMQQYINILQLFNKDDLKTLLVSPNILITIDTPLKEIAWIVVYKNLNFDFICQNLKNKI